MRCSPLLLLAPLAAAFTLDISSTSSIETAASSIAYEMMTAYVGNETGEVPGLLPGSLSCDPNTVGVYCWWEAGAMWGALINYWQYTNDTTYNSVVSQALQFQRGSDNNFNPANQSRSMGIDDQVFWAFSAMDAVEANFPEAGDDDPSWLSLAQAVFNFQRSLWDTAYCGGGFRWQVYSFNAGYNLKNSISNGGNFQLSARLAYVTGNSTYGDWAEEVYDWMESSPLLEMDNSTGIFYIWDNTDTDNNCSDVQNYVWSYNYGTMLMGAAYMYNYTNGSSVWLDRVETILNSTFTLFFPSTYGGNIMFEVECEAAKNCDQDQKSFKAYLARWLAVTGLLVPSTMDSIKTKLSASATGAAGQCDVSDAECGLQWYTTTWDGTNGVGQQMAALSVVGANLIDSSMTPLTKVTGATSSSDPDAGTTATSDPAETTSKITTKDRAGAGILTVLVIGFIVGGAAWIVI
ncbi:mannan endo-1,6-alpha-mannosidase [Exophiala viscosa]|uniref:Mannan endo-1,6-alpha-mannosidase n=1 Tax=Exophiala viscosa TaxID=2486360 RepID=A0AAN6IGC3_9EURO|nr:mannan endo-1,6-alpha-mannosidase [Exophiala viscosa]KAI1621524.1 mannan endo-1,6-alpha-mannosidase [Exophiala viscosa]